MYLFYYVWIKRQTLCKTYFAVMSKECLLRKGTFYWMKRDNCIYQSIYGHLIYLSKIIYTPRTVRTVHCLRQHDSCVVLHGKFSLGATCTDADFWMRKLKIYFKLLYFFVTGYMCGLRKYADNVSCNLWPAVGLCRIFLQASTVWTAGNKAHCKCKIQSGN